MDIMEDMVTVADTMADMDLDSMEEHCTDLEFTGDYMDLDLIIPDTMEVITTAMDLDTSFDK